MPFLFFYGSLKVGKSNHNILGNSKVYIDEAITSSKEFTMFGGGFPFVSDHDFGNPDDTGSIIGELYEITNPAVLANIDRMEGVPALYVKREVEVVTLSQLEYTATMYVASAGSNDRLKRRPPMKPQGRGRYLEWN